jgi:prephenate dehydrogenase
MRICMLGLGLIGGSIARAVAAHDDVPATDGRPSLVAWTPAGDGPRAALAAGVIADVARDLTDAVRGADLVLLAAPALATLRLLDDLAGLEPGILRPTATVTDVASTKAAIVGRADALGLRFVGGHPMAGRETAGFGASAADLFVGRPWVIVPGRGASAEDVARVEWLASACGARPVRMPGEAHDAAVAAISHAPLVVAAALVEAVAGAPGERSREDWDTVRSLAAGGWRDMTRLARGDPEMGMGMLATNATAVVARLRDVRDRLDTWIAALDASAGPDAAALLDRLAADRGRARETRSAEEAAVDGPDRPA